MRSTRQPSVLTRAQISSTSAKDRPVCPSCGRRCPLRGTLDCDDVSWGDYFAHRCAHGEPCAAWGKPIGETCAACAERPEGKVVEDFEIDVALVVVRDDLEGPDLPAARFANVVRSSRRERI